MLSRTSGARRVAVALLALTAALFTPLAAATAQQGMVRGRVVDRSSNGGIAGAELVSLGDNRSVKTDSAGRYLFAALPAGPVQLLVRAPAFPVTQIVITLAADAVLERTIVLDSTAARAGGQPLPAVVVSESEIDGRLVDFERRRRLGRGHYLTRAEIERSGANSLQDAVRTLRGVTMECGGGGGCFVRMVRAPMHCKPDYVVDRRIDNNFGPSTPIRDIEALEIYTGPSDVPGEFAGRSAGCGVIVVWTRAGPPRRQ